MKPTLRSSIAITALSTAGLVFAADPPTPGMDLGAMKLKSRPAPPAPAANVVGGTATPAQAPAVAPPGRPGIVAPAATAAAAPAPAPAPTTAAASNTPSPPQSGIGNVVASPVGKKGIDVLGTTAATSKTAQDNSTDVKVKMPSMFRKQ